MKYITAISILLISAACTNAVVISCVSEPNNVVKINYDSSDETILPIAFALDVTVDNGAVISKVFDYKTGDSTKASPGYGIFPHTMQFDPSGNVSNWGTPNVDGTVAGALGGVGTSGVTLQMTTRYKGDANAPLVKGTLCRILVDTKGASTVNVKAVQNNSGGGVVLKNASAAKFSSTGVIITPGGGTPPPSAPPAPLSISYPTTNNTGNYSITWSTSSGATSYLLERSANSGSTWTQVYSGAALTFSDTVTSGTYYYHVKAINANGSSDWTSGSWGCVVSISVPPVVPAVPALITYPATSGTGNYAVTWAASTGATSYQLERSANSGSTWTPVYSGAALTFSDTVTNGTYSYRVKATNSAGSSEYRTGSSGCVVSIPAPPASVPAIPASITYPATSNTGKYTVAWPASSGATSYQLERTANNGSTWTAVYNGTAVSYSESVANGTYRYRLKATNSAGSSAWRTASSNCVVSIPKPTRPAAPASFSYPKSSSTGTYTISWSASSGATSYQLQRLANDGSWKQIYSGTAITYSESVKNGAYKYRVRATNEAGSSVWKITDYRCTVRIPSSRERETENEKEND